MSGFKTSSWLIILGIILVGVTGYAIGQSPIASLENTLNRIETENIALQSQVEKLNDDNQDFQELLESTLTNLSAAVKRRKKRPPSSILSLSTNLSLSSTIHFAAWERGFHS